jgi:trehalose 6-phosphate synthase
LLLNERDGVLALSDKAGAHDELGAIAVTLRPFDVEQQADALYDALEMPRPARRARAEIGVDIVRTNDVHKWLRQQLSDIERLSGRTMPLQVSV